MKRLVASFGAVALGASACHTAQAIDLSPRAATKPWSVGVALRGFYDDNYLYAPRNSDAVRESWGFEVRPSVGFNVAGEQTYFAAGYTFSGMYYEDPARSSDPWDISHIADLMFNHAFSRQVTLQISDRFVYSDRPELVDPTIAPTLRTDNTGMNNRAKIGLNIGLSPVFGLSVGYQNNWFDYENENPAAENAPPAPGAASLSARLDRFEHLIPVRLSYQAAPPTAVFAGYTFGMYDYTSDEFLFAYAPALGLGPGARADTRNFRTHIVYVGAEHNFTPLLSLAVSGGAQFSDFYNDPVSDNSTTPYGDISFSYLYTAGSSATIGYSLSQQSTDLLSPDLTTGAVTQNRLVSSLYGRIIHQFFPQLKGSLFGQWQLSQYEGGSLDGDTENLYLLGANLRYDFTRFLSADIGYALDYLDSGLQGRGGGYTRNRVYLGVNATY